MLDKLDAALRFQQEALNLPPSVRKCWQQTSPMPIPLVIRRAISILPVNLKKSCNVDGMQPVWLH